MNFNFVIKLFLVSKLIGFAQVVFANEYMTEELVKKQCQIFISGGHFHTGSVIPITQDMLDGNEIAINTTHFHQKNPLFVTDFKIRLYRGTDTKTQQTFYRAGVVMLGMSTDKADSCLPRRPSHKMLSVLDHFLEAPRTAVVTSQIDFVDEKISEAKQMSINFPGISKEMNEFQMQIKCAK